MANTRGAGRSNSAAKRPSRIGNLECTSSDVRVLSRSQRLARDIAGTFVDRFFAQLLSNSDSDFPAPNSADLNQSKTEFKTYFQGLFIGESFHHDPGSSEFVHGLDTRYYLTTLPLVVDLFESLANDHPTLAPANLPRLVNSLSKKLWLDALSAATSYASHRDESVDGVETESKTWQEQAETE
jgi:hypothetical protein